MKTTTVPVPQPVITADGCVITFEQHPRFRTVYARCTCGKWVAGYDRLSLTKRRVAAHTQEHRPRRTQYGRCPSCEAAEDQWCSSDCPSLDPMDYR